jgi:hypothetical protein
MSKHTPGPWKVAKPQKSHANGKLMYGIVGPEIVADYEDWGFTEANARLIAAAPDLLEVLSEVVKFWDSIVPTDCINDMHIKARAAIARAEGEN